jgi:hypothetical protein
MIMNNVLNIITPCYKPSCLDYILNSFDSETLINWYIVYSKNVNKSQYFINRTSNLKVYQFFSGDSTENKNKLFNWGLDLVKDGFIYFLDDTKSMHPNFWNWFNHFEKRKIYTFLNEEERDAIVIRESGDGFWYICHSINSHRIHPEGFPSQKEALLNAPKIIKNNSFEDLFIPCDLDQGYIDYNMCCFDSILLNGHRLQTESDNCYSDFISKIYAGNQKCLRYIDKKIAY